MKIVAAIDSFKGSLSTYQAGEAVKRGVLSVYPSAEVVISPIADGGEGTLDAIISSASGSIKTLEVTGPLGERRMARWGALPDGKTAVVEIAEAAGITLVPPEKRNPMHTTTRGVGELIRDGILSGYRRFIVGLGGSVTNDGGAGMLSSLGFELLDRDKSPITDGAAGLEELCEIRADKVVEGLFDCEFILACDVKNPLCGECGASRIFAPQKGAKEKDIPLMDAWLDSFSDCVKKLFPASSKNREGAGAAGGLGFAFMSCLGGVTRRGIDLVTELSGLEEQIRTADIIVTGEGRLDAQTAMGKAPVGVAALAKKYSKPVIAFSGCVARDAEILSENGIDAYFPIVRGATSLEEAMDAENAANNLRDTAVQVFRLIKRIGDIK